ncbi:MAG TPA: sigma 54-interacting transcriptional regulator [Galbitalea sp.]
MTTSLPGSVIANVWFVGSSPMMQELRIQIARAASTRLPVLIEGPTGSGKELVAQALHSASESASGGRIRPLVAVNVCAIAESLFEDEMFGHVQGAFSGAITDRVGLLREADHGTLFFDEISGLTIGAQSKLLRAIETGVFRQVGARVESSSDFRLVSATNISLDEAVRAGSFRSDLRYRLRGVTIRVPALAEHAEDIPELARHFAREARVVVTKELSDGALSILESSPWPGNVRQLRSIVECSVAFADGPNVGRDDVLRVIEQSHSSILCDGDDVERRHLIDILRTFDWDTKRTAENLGVHRASVYRRMHQLGIGARQRRRYGA